MRKEVIIEWVKCERCGYFWPAEENKSPSVARETTCQRCLIAEVAKLTRLLKNV